MKDREKELILEVKKLKKENKMLWKRLRDLAEITDSCMDFVNQLGSDIKKTLEVNENGRK